MDLIKKDILSDSLNQKMIKLMSLVDRKHVAVFMNDSKQYKIDLATA